MTRKIIAIAGRPGLYKIVSQGNRMLIVEQLLTGKRMPAYARDKVSSLADISIYTSNGEDRPLNEVFELVSKKNEAKEVDIKAIGDNAAVREYFAGIMPDFDEERVYTADIIKLLKWYNILVQAGVTDFRIDEDIKEEEGDKAE